MKPLVSVIIPAYNHEKYIRKAIDCVLSQSYPKIEIIVIDDGSKDATYDIVKDIVAASPEGRFIIRSKANEGVCKTLNMGLGLASGDYIAFLASDDYWAPTKIEEQVSFLEKKPTVGLAFSDCFFVLGEEETTTTWKDYKRPYMQYFENGISVGSIYQELMIYCFIPALTVMLRASTLRKVGCFDEKLIYEDDDMWLRFALESQIGYIDKPLAYYRMHDSNVSRNIRFMLRGYWGTIRKHFSLKPLCDKPLLRFRLILQILANQVWSRVRKILIRVLGNKGKYYC
jgi:alpha-1,3-rhamnosyltransferase